MAILLGLTVRENNNYHNNMYVSYIASEQK